MAQRPRITTRTVEEIEDVIDVIDEIFADGIVEPQELDRLVTEVREAHYHAGYVDATFAYGMSVFHNGAESDRSQRLEKDLVDLTSYRAQKEQRRDRSNDPDAA